MEWGNVTDKSRHNMCGEELLVGGHSSLAAFLVLLLWSDKQLSNSSVSMWSCIGTVCQPSLSCFVFSHFAIWFFWGSGTIMFELNLDDTQIYLWNRISLFKIYSSRSTLTYQKWALRQTFYFKILKYACGASFMLILTAQTSQPSWPHPHRW